MQNRTSVLSFLVVAAGTAALLATTAQSQFGTPKNYVSLQPTTPGTSQSGHSNVSGTSKAGQFVGGGAGLSNVNADLLDGLDSSAFMSSASPLIVSGTQNGLPVIRGSNASTAANSIGILGEITSTSPGSFSAGVSGVNLGTGGFGIGVWGSQNGGGWGVTGVSVSGRGVYGSATGGSGVSTGVYGESASTSGTGVFGSASAASGSTFGGSFHNFSPSGTGVFGAANATSGSTYGGSFHNFSTSGTGVFGWARATTGTTSGVNGQSDSPAGRGIHGRNSALSGPAYGGYFESIATGASVPLGATAVFGIATSTSGFGYGVRGRSMSENGTGVFGEAYHATGNTSGVYGLAFSELGNGVYGYASGGGTGISGNTQGGSGIGRGVWGTAFNPGGRGVQGDSPSTTGVGYGVFGSAPVITSGFAVFASGDMGASGVKPFRIDHPYDPENKYLLHYAAESPMPQNFYVGNVVTDAKGYAWVELPDYFAEINANCKYQLTVVDGPNSNADDFVQVKVRQKIVGNRFQIRTSMPNVEVSWRVDADRNDLYVRHKEPKDVVEKEGLERGKYQHPELYGMPKERGMNYRPELETLASKPKR